MNWTLKTDLVIFWGGFLLFQKALATFILQSKDCSILLRNGVREPLTHACTDLKSSNEICVLSQVITIW